MAKRTFRIIMALAVVMVLSLGLVGQSVAASSANDNGQGRYIVVFNTGVNDAAKGALTRQFGGVVEEPIALIGNANVVFLPPQAVQGFMQSGKVLRVEEDAVVTASGKPTPTPTPPPAEVLPWGVERVNANDVWPDTGTGVKVAIIDTGIDKDHPDLFTNIKGGQNFVSIRGSIDSSKWDDDNGHGTHVAGIVAGIDNDIGVIGVAPNASLYAVKVLDKRGSGYVSSIINGIGWCIDNGIKVINMSLGTTSDVQSFHDACDLAYASGIVLVAAAGNSGGTDSVNYPAKYSSVIAVSATDSSNAIASWSSNGAEVELAAPGVSIYSTYMGGGYATLSGTSMASPHVTGTVALVLANNSSLTPDGVRAKLESTASDLGITGLDNYYGYGLVDAYAAVATP